MTLKNDLETAWNSAAPADQKAAPAAILRQKRDDMLNNLKAALNTPQSNGLKAMFTHADELDQTLSEVMDF